MDAFRIVGGARLSGKHRVEGSKNAALPLMAAAILADEPVILRDVPHFVDVSNMGMLLRELGCRCDHVDGVAHIETVDSNACHARYEIVKTMRASICALGPLVAKRGHASVSMPGGCALGIRPVDLHLRGLEALGVTFDLKGGDILAKCDRLIGNTVFLGGPFGSTVLGTANVMSAATLARGRTIIESAATEPEIVDLARMLNAMGAKISGAGTPRITIEGVDQLGGVDHQTMPDRIVAGTFAMAAAMTNGTITLENFPYDCLLGVVDHLDRIGVHISNLDTSDDPLRTSVHVCSDRVLQPLVMTTQPYPGFPTDLQAQLVTLLTQANGNSIVTEKIFPERFNHVAELTRMGAEIVRQGPTAIIQGPTPLRGAPVMASDLRGSASLVLAGLAAEGETIVSRVYHLDRGYIAMEESLNKLGAKIERINPDQDNVMSESPLVTSFPQTMNRAQTPVAAGTILQQMPDSTASTDS